MTRTRISAWHAAFRRSIAAAVALIGAACAPPDHPRDTRSLERCRYETSVDASLMLRAQVRCDGAIEALTATELAVVPHLVVSDAVGEEGRHRFSSPVALARYSMDLAALAAESGDPDVAYAHQGGCITAVSSWLLRPEPSRGDTRIEVAMMPLEGAGFATGLRREGDHHWLEAREIAHATYAVMGRFERDLLLVPARGGEARLELATLPGPLRADAPSRRRWIGDAAAAVGVFWRGFPVDRALVAIVPTLGHPGSTMARWWRPEARAWRSFSAPRPTSPRFAAIGSSSTSCSTSAFPPSWARASGSTRVSRPTTSPSFARARVGWTSGHCGSSSPPVCRSVATRSSARV
jgi:hypothetical protein